MEEFTASDLKRIYSYKNLQTELKTLKKSYSLLMSKHSQELRLRETIIKKEVEAKTKEYTDTIKDKDKPIEAS